MSGIILTAKASEVSIAAEGEASNVNYLNSLNGQLIAGEFVPDGNSFWGPFSAANPAVPIGGSMGVIGALSGKGIVLAKIYVWASIAGKYTVSIGGVVHFTLQLSLNGNAAIDFSPGAYYWPVAGVSMVISNLSGSISDVSALVVARQFDL